jgi:succinate-semialdehyde dehydrogenase/glutarate-semialdehyde dehydrogenase
MSMQSINPATGEVIREFETLTDAEVERALETAEERAREWRTVSFDRRSELLRRAAGVLRDDQDRWARLMTEEMGKPIAQARAEVEKCAWVCDFYADNAEGFLEPTSVDTDASRSGVRFDPIGAVLAVMPWNFPFWQVFRFAAPALMAGNVGLLKHASNVSGCSLAIEEVFRRAGFPEGCFQSLLIESDAVADVIASDVVKAVTLTGSERAGRAVAAQAGKHLKKTVLELGGSDPFIVLDDVDVQEVAEHATRGRTQNNGQSCIAAKRFLVAESIADDFVEAFCSRLESLNVGDPMDEANDLGPLAREDILEDLHDQVARSVEEGAKLVTGGGRLNGTGFYYTPTLLDAVSPGMAAFDEETFGPLAAVARVADEAEAVELANHTRFGLGASIWSGDPERAAELVPRIDAGCVFVNGIVKSDPRLPFGGVKASGYGRELASYGIREFVNEKTYWVG